MKMICPHRDKCKICFLLHEENITRDHCIVHEKTESCKKSCIIDGKPIVCVPYSLKHMMKEVLIKEKGE